MNLYQISEDERRIICKQALESLEFWLRRMIHDILYKKYGSNYLHAKKSDGGNIINNKIMKSIQDRKDAEPARYQRLIDASLLENQIDIICNPELYNECFKIPLELAYPDGREEARTFLKRLEYPRNCLYHANPVSVRMSEQVICYTNDVIDSLKKFYTMNNQEKEYDVPIIIKFSDSFGNTFHRTNSDNIANLDFSKNPNCILYPGDILRIEVEVDPSYTGKYKFRFGGVREYEDSNVLVYTVKVSDPQPSMVIHCQVKSDKAWHKLSGRDDQISVYYKVLPPRD